MDLKNASEKLKSYNAWNIFTHSKSDGDAMGSASALFEAGLNIGKIVKWYTPDLKMPEVYKFLKHSDEVISCESFDFAEDEGKLNVFLDCSNENRSVKGFDIHKNINVLNIDHHEDNTLFGNVNCVDGKASSTCEMLYRIFTFDNWKITEDIAISLYTGIFTDTGGFSFSNTSSLTHEAAAKLISYGVKSDIISDYIRQNKTSSDFKLWSRAMERVKISGFFAISEIYIKDFDETGSDYTGTEGLSSMLMTLIGIKLAVFITEYPNNEIRLSIRSREGSPVNAGELARSFGGGGHERAAGATLKTSIQNAVNEVKQRINEIYHERININE